MDDAHSHDEETIPPFLHLRPKGPAVDHIAVSVGRYQEELARAVAAIKVIDLRMENNGQAIAQLRRQQAEDQRELDQLVRAKKSAERAIAELHGVEL